MTDPAGHKRRTFPKPPQWRMHLAQVGLAILISPACSPGPSDARDTTEESPAGSGISAAPTAEPGEVSDGAHRYTNQLIHETSPYLLQHAHNPVDWNAWGPDALARALEEDKPIFLSIGYSTCYWCHVMEKESFEDEDVAKLLNEHFIAIKVDREERPDIDEQYMLATQLVTGRGGWPNSIWLTPDGRPWMAGTYFPKDRFMQLLTGLADYWENNREDAEKQADQLADSIRRYSIGGRPSRPVVGGGSVDQQLIDTAIGAYRRAFDEKLGGFGSAPKFPPHGALRLLAHEYRRTQDAGILRMITRTLDGMWLGGVHDHLGGGFHRYSTDQKWLLPHFEKMLYDNAQLMRSYTDAFLLTGTHRYRAAVEDIYRWVEREMTSPRGAFFSALDSGEVDKEGEAYLWRLQDVIDVLGTEDAEVFTSAYHVDEAGNFREESTGKQQAKNILHLDASLDEVAGTRGEEPDAFRSRMAAMRSKLLTRRQTWEQPRKDDKVLSSWNGLMIGALAYAGRQLGEPRYTVAALRAANFLLDQVTDDRGRPLRTYRSGEAKIPGYLDDYAYLSEAFLELHLATSDARWLREADRLAEVMLSDFEDVGNGAFFFTGTSHQTLLVRSKNLMGGGNVPSANGVAAMVLLELGRRTSKPAYTQAAQRTLDALADLMWQNPRSLESAILASAMSLQPSNVPQLLSISMDEADLTMPLGPVTAHLFSSTRDVRPGQEFNLAVVLDVAEGWHLYGPNPGVDFVLPTTIEASGSDTLVFGRTAVPEARVKLDPVLKQSLATYEGRVAFVVPVTIKNDAADGLAKLTIGVTTQACDQSRCLPPRTDELELVLDITSNAPEAPARHQELFKALSLRGPY